jgi:hypothetical protein
MTTLYVIGASRHPARHVELWIAERSRSLGLRTRGRCSEGTRLMAAGPVSAWAHRRLPLEVEHGRNPREQEEQRRVLR